MKKVLIVEDDRFLANAYKLAFDSTAYDVQIASDGEEGLKLAQEIKPDAMILDLLLPEKDGFTVLTEIMSNPDLKGTKVIIASNLGQQSDIDRGKALGATDYIIKSETSITDVIAKVEEALGISK